ncbi:MAG: DNA mismatch repair endonuclease MutL [Clostridia bacterium]|nr:DNA mismatch repair endonuclease MutL [Clostridia bacterium]NCC74925.1 DNA mismatch repair endonuclease MutL [Clostridia bacterium]
MSVITVLDTQTANSIAAGEVVERPASVVKELVENALDAGASVIHVEIRQGGISYIRVTDNGCGMDETDAQLAFGRHATSKIRSIDDLEQISTMGFRGEALASIAAVAKVRLETRPLGQASGTAVEITAGEMVTMRPAGCPEGTTLTIENLFFNTPARFKFLKKDSTEAAAVADVLERIALARPDVSIRLVSQGNELLHTPGNNDLRSAIFAVFGKEAASAIHPLDYAMVPVQVSGYIGTPEAARSSRNQQCIYVNGRLVKSRAVSAAIDEAYATHLMKRKHPLAVLKIDLPTPLVDVNVHPQKMEVRFWEEQTVFRAVYHGIQNALQSGGAIVESTPLAVPGSGLAAAPAPVQIALPQPVDAPSTAILDYTAGPDMALPDPVGVLVQETPVGSERPVHDATASLQQSQASDAQAAPAVSRPKTITSLQSARLIGQLFATYLVLEHEQDLLLLDQHAAHERILFEQLVARHRSRGPAAVQPLLIPQTIEVSAREQAILLAEQENLLQLGFEFEAFGSQSILLRSLPDSGRYTLKPQAAMRVLLDTLMSDKLHSEEQIDDLYYSMACKAAIKAHDKLDVREMEQLLSDLAELEDPYHCPHGRPVIIRISRYELEKQFKRIV